MTYTLYKTDASCKWCDKAIELASSLKIDMKVKQLPNTELIELATMFDRHPTIPLIFKDEELIGGYNEFERHTESTAKVANRV